MIEKETKKLPQFEKPARAEIQVNVDYVGFTLEESPWVDRLLFG